MQTLIFNTATKQVRLLNGPRDNARVLEIFENVSTVRVEVNYYEVMQKNSTEEDAKSIPVMRVPISNTNMILQHEK
jgi:hypothetical protein